MAKRKTIPKKIRFDVFARDKFTCQYCGKSAPDVVLEVDHIVPVSKGGTNDVMNLVTSCFDCNRGKGPRVISDDSAMKARKAQIDMMADRREQLEMMYNWQLDLANGAKAEVDKVSDLIYEMTGYNPTDSVRDDIKSLIGRFGFDLVIEATRIAFTSYRTSNEDELDFAFDKIGGICFNKTHKTCGLCLHDIGYDPDRHLVECEYEHDGDYWVRNSYAEKCPKFERRYGGRNV